MKLSSWFESLTPAKLVSDDGAEGVRALRGPPAASCDAVKLWPAMAGTPGVTSARRFMSRNTDGAMSDSGSSFSVASGVAAFGPLSERVTARGSIAFAAPALCATDTIGSNAFTRAAFGAACDECTAIEGSEAEAAKTANRTIRAAANAAIEETDFFIGPSGSKRRPLV